MKHVSLCETVLASLVSLIIGTGYVGASTTAAAEKDKAPLSEYTNKEAWDQVNDPLRLSREFDINFNNLPTTGDADYIAWSGDGWSAYQGGIAYRWNDPEHDGFSYRVLSRREVESMSSEQLSRLSPAEKFDILRGDYTFSTVKAERARTNRQAARWHGLCHAWAPASIHFEEPAPTTMRNRDGIEIPFGSSDVKALLIYGQHQMYTERRGYRTLGARCNPEDVALRRTDANSACQGTNPGAFHVVLTNYIGIRRHSFVAEIANQPEVWNKPVMGYDFDYTEVGFPYRETAPNTAKVYKVRTTMYYVDSSAQSWNRVQANFRDRLYEYYVEVAANGRILGGRWISDDRPDFVWLQEPADFRGHLESIRYLYNRSVGFEAFPEP